MNGAAARVAQRVPRVPQELQVRPDQLHYPPGSLLAVTLTLLRYHPPRMTKSSTVVLQRRGQCKITVAHSVLFTWIANCYALAALVLTAICTKPSLLGHGPLPVSLA